MRAFGGGPDIPSVDLTIDMNRIFATPLFGLTQFKIISAWRDHLTKPVDCVALAEVLELELLRTSILQPLSSIRGLGKRLQRIVGLSLSFGAVGIPRAEAAPLTRRTSSGEIDIIQTIFLAPATDGRSNEFLPTVHGFDEFFGNLVGKELLRHVGGPL
jgi:hypothetical protein